MAWHGIAQFIKQIEYVACFLFFLFRFVFIFNVINFDKWKSQIMSIDIEKEISIFTRIRFWIQIRIVYFED